MADNGKNKIPIKIDVSFFMTDACFYPMFIVAS